MAQPLKSIAVFVQLLVLAAVSAAADTDKPAGSPRIDLDSGSVEGVCCLDRPDEVKSVLRPVRLPDFKRACFFAPDDPDFRWIGASNRMIPWVAGEDLRDIYGRADDQNPAFPPPNRRGLFLLLDLRDGGCLALLALAGPRSCAFLEVEKNGALAAGYDTAGSVQPDRGPIPLVAWARADDAQEACRKVWQQALQLSVFEGRVRSRGEKEYPEYARYLGWCSWEQFHHGINEGVLCDVVDEIDASDVPVRWILIDDGHQTDRGTSLVSLVPDRKKFPRGWGPLLEKRRPDGVRWIGIWHCLLAQWGNIAAQHDMPWLAPYLVSTEPGNPKATLVPKVDPKVSLDFYDAFVGEVRKQGFDFLKVDNMSRSTFAYAKGPYNPAQAEWINAHSLDLATHRYGLPFISCSAQNSICLLNNWYNAVMRCSVDYRLNDAASAKSHVFQSFANTLWLGQTLWPDHDMFHSADAFCGELMAVTKALSGGPVYLSDRPRDFQAEYIKPLCYEDGLLLRPLAPAAPFGESVFRDALNDREKAYEVSAPVAAGAVVVAAFNLVHPTPDRALKGTVTADDFERSWGLTQPPQETATRHDEGLVVYDWCEGTGGRLSDDGLAYSIKGFDYRLFTLAPIRQGWAVIGRADKYLAPAAVEAWEATPETLTVTLHESGPTIIYSDRSSVQCPDADFQSIGEGLWRADLPVHPSPVTLEIHRGS